MELKRERIKWIHDPPEGEMSKRIDRYRIVVERMDGGEDDIFGGGMAISRRMASNKHTVMERNKLCNPISSRSP